jgi:4-amino-4-deoxy-L-arabinose transferase-like glycosyltransferase
MPPGVTRGPVTEWTTVPLISSPPRPEPDGASPARFLVLLGLYAALHVGLRLALSSVVAIDDAREALFSQTLQAGYLPRQPPLYNWLAWAGVRALGVHAAALIVCRYLTLGLAYLFLYLSGVRVLGSRHLAILAAFSLLLMGPFNWDVHEELTHSLAALAASAATFYALLRVERSGHPRDYVGLGVAVAAGFLAKFSYGFFAGSLLLATLATPAYRRRILTPRAMLALAIAVALCLPYGLWFAHRELSLVRMFAEEVRPESAVGYARGVARGLGHLGRMLAIYLMPFALVFPAVFWRARPRNFGAGGAARRLLGALLLVELGLVVVGILTGSLTFLKFRWLMPAFCLVPLLAFAWIDQAALARNMTRRYAVALGIAEAIVVLGLILNVLRGDAFGPPTRLNAPYDRVAAELRAAGFSGGTIAAGNGPLAGNLRLRFPAARVVRLTNPDYLPPRAGEGQCLVVWEEGLGNPAALLAWMRARLGVDVEGEAVRTVWVPYHHARALALHVGYVFLPAGRGDCR